MSRVTGPGSTPLHYWNYFGVCPKTVSPLTSSNNLHLISIFYIQSVKNESKAVQKCRLMRLVQSRVI